MKLSIIIPVYRVAETLRRCLDSVIGQSYQDWEIVLVNDASPDNSDEICKEYTQKDTRIRYVEFTVNRGLSAARNAGIREASGEYITFIDSDDYIALNTLEPLMAVMCHHPEYDFLEYPVWEHFGGSQQHLLSFPRKTYTDRVVYWLKSEAYRHAYAWNKIFRHSLFNNVAFPEGLNFEDVWTLPQVLRNCKVVATTDVGCYYYTENLNGITHRATLQDLRSHLQAHLTVIRQLHPAADTFRFDSCLTEDFARYYAAVLNILIDIGDATLGPMKGPPFEGRDSFPILPYHQTIKLKLLHLLGIRYLCQYHRTFQRLRSSLSSCRHITCL